jgi:hypothetical protein
MTRLSTYRLLACLLPIACCACDFQPVAKPSKAESVKNADTRTSDPAPKEEKPKAAVPTPADGSRVVEDVVDEEAFLDVELAEIEDHAFDRFVDVKIVRKAIQELDTGLLVDVTLQTAEGERVLGRERNGFSANALLNAAIRAATDAGDKESLERLAKAVEVMGKPELVMPIEMALKLADAPRKVDAGPKVPLRELTPEAMVLFKTFVREIKICRTVGDRQGLENLRVTIVQLDGLHPRQQEYLTEKLIDGLAAVPADPDPSAATLAQLAGVTRRGDSKAIIDDESAVETAVPEPALP